MNGKSLRRLLSLALTAILLVMLLCMTGCDNTANINVDLRTEMSVDGSFAGKRVMTVSFDQTLAETGFKTLDALDALVSKEMPSTLTKELVTDESGARYVFTLSFASLDDYIQKVAGLIGRQPNVTFDSVDKMFMKGLTYQEDFESCELFSWVDKGVKNLTVISRTDLFDSASFWRQTGVNINVGDSSFSSSGGRIDVTQGKETLISKISFKTTVKKNESYERTIEFRLSPSIYEDNYADIVSFLERQKPEGAIVTQSAVSDSKVVSVVFKARNIGELYEKTSKVLGTSCTADFRAVEDSSLPFSTLEEFRESLDFTNLCMDTKVPFSYNLVSESGSPSQLSVILDGEVIDGQPTLGGNTLDYGAEGSVMELTTRFESISTAKSIYYNLIELGTDDYKREIVIMMENGTPSDVLEKIKSFYESKEAKNTVITTSEEGYAENSSNPCVCIEISGSGKDIAKAEEMLFAGTTERKLSYERQKSIFKVKPQTALEDSFDISSLLSMTNVTEYIYTFTSKRDDITGSSRTIAGVTDMSEDEKKAGETVGYLMTNGSASLKFDGKYTNVEAIIFIILLIILALLILALIGVMLYKYLKDKKKDEVPEKRVQPVPEVVEEYYPEPEPEPIPIALPEPEPPRDLGFAIEQEEEFKPEIEIESFPSTTKETDFDLIFNSMDLAAQDEEEEPEPEPEDTHKVPVHPFVPVYIEPQPEPEPEPVVIPEPEPEPKAPEVPFAKSPYEDDDYSDADMLDDFDRLGLLDSYIDRVSKVKVKVKKRKVEDK